MVENNEKTKRIIFTRNKEYEFIKYVGKGGTGRTVLLHDSLLDIDFICKKYEPVAGNDKNECFQHFIGEIKILYQLAHINVVRVYSYHLYPEHLLGYILMEHIDGDIINNYLTRSQEEAYNNIFIQLIEGFNYLETNAILHRDIKSDNILITRDGIVKIIDFGFGKKFEGISKNEASILLNWPVSELPDEINNSCYDHKTDIYFLGKMFNKILVDNGINNFKYQNILNQMIVLNPEQRIHSFSDIINLLYNNISNQFDFDHLDKNAYMNLAESLSGHLNYYLNKIPTFYSDPKVIIKNLETLILNTLLEEFLQDNRLLFNCFFNGGYNYNAAKNINVEHIRTFYDLLRSQPDYKQTIIVNNIISRLKSINVKSEEYDDVPF